MGRSRLRPAATSIAVGVLTVACLAYLPWQSVRASDAGTLARVTFLPEGTQVGPKDRHGHGVSLVQHTLRIDAIESIAQSQVLNLALQLGVPTTHSVAVNALVELQTFAPHGELVTRSPAATEPLRIEPGQAVEFTNLRTPKSIPDGYYRTSLVYAADDGQHFDESFEEVCYRVQSGIIEVLEPSLWREESGENLGTFIEGSDRDDWVNPYAVDSKAMHASEEVQR